MNSTSLTTEYRLDLHISSLNSLDCSLHSSSLTLLKRSCSLLPLDLCSSLHLESSRLQPFGFVWGFSSMSQARSCIFQKAVFTCVAHSLDQKLTRAAPGSVFAHHCIPDAAHSIRCGPVVSLMFALLVDRLINIDYHRQVLGANYSVSLLKERSIYLLNKQQV